MPINHDASFVDTLPRNVAVQFLERVEKSAANEAFRYPDGDSWTSVTWKEVGDEVSRLAAGLMALGIEPEQRVGISSGTRYEWILADLAIMCAGAATTTVYPSTNADDTTYILSDSESHVRLRGGRRADQEAARQQGRAARTSTRSSPSTAPSTATGSSGCRTWPSSATSYLADKPDAVVEHAAAIGPDQLATLIYTSGTTGRPKGVRLRHQSWVYEGEAIAAQNILDETDLEFRWLPMAHSFGKVLMSTQMACGFAAAIDGRVDKIIDNLAVVKPTFMGAAPRIFEKAHGRIITMQAAEGGAKEMIFKKAFEVGLKVDQLKREGKSVPLLLKLQHGCLRQVGVLQDPRPLRWTRPVLHLRCGALSTARSPSGSTPRASSSSRATASPRPRPARS